MRSIIGLIILLLAADISWAQTCEPAIPAATPTKDFVLNDDGTALHIPTGLMWSRCSLGQMWADKQCHDAGGLADNYFVWQNSLIKASQFKLAGHNDWRLPSIKELTSIVETRCTQPAINLEVFPGTPISEVYWTSTPSSFPENQAWYVSFYNGSDNNYVKSNLNRVRPVRNYFSE